MINLYTPIRWVQNERATQFNAKRIVEDLRGVNIVAFCKEISYICAWFVSGSLIINTCAKCLSKEIIKHEKWDPAESRHFHSCKNALFNGLLVGDRWLWLFAEQIFKNLLMKRQLNSEYLVRSLNLLLTG